MTTPSSDAPPPDYPRATGAPRTAPTRPGVVTAAAVLGIVWGGLTILSSLLSMVGGSILRSVGSACAPNDESGLCAFVADSSTLLITVGSALILAAILLIWGSVGALNGKSATVLAIAGAIQIVIQIVWMIASGSLAFGIVGVIVPIVIIALVLSAASRAWFQASRAAR